MKTFSIQRNEVLAWFVVICALVLLSCVVAFAQDKTSPSKVHIKIEKDENGKKTKIDTTVSEENLPQLKERLKESGVDFDEDDQAFHLDNSSPGNITIHYDKEKLKKDMKKMHEDLAKMKDELKDIHIEIFGDGDKDGEHLNFDMKVPPSPPVPGKVPSPPHSFWFDDEDFADMPGDKGAKHRTYSYSYSFHDVPDSLNDGNHVIIRGKEGEEKPEFEKEITGKHGEKIFVFKRKVPKETVEKATTSLGINRVKVYPNPSNGKISVSFNSASNGDVSVIVTDVKGKEVYSDLKKDFSGQYANQIDLSEKGKGTYFVKITQGDDSVTKKIIVE